MRAFVFPGQGSEYACMLKELYEGDSRGKDFIDSLNLSFDIKEIYVGESGLIHDTRFSQPGNFVFGYLLSEMLKEKGILPDACAGLSLGEYSALACAGAVDARDALSVLEKRAELMYSALDGADTGMQAVMFLSREAIEDAAAGFDKVWVANYNSPDQIVIAGDNTQLKECAMLCTERGAKKTVKLDVTGAFHTPLLEEASEALSQILDGYEMRKPEIPVYSDLTGDKYDNDVRTPLVKQLYNPVRFEEIISNMISDGTDEFYTIGAGRATDGFIRSTALKMKAKVRIQHIEKISDIR